MATRNERNGERYWTMERVFQVGVPAALVTGVALLILVQLLATPRGGARPVQQVRPRTAPTAAVDLLTPHADAASATEAAAETEPATMQIQEPTMAAPVEALPTIASINCQSPTSPEDVAVCNLTNAQSLLPQAIPASISQGSGRVQGSPASVAPTVHDQAPISNLQPIATSAVPLCSEMTRPIRNCRGDRP